MESEEMLFNKLLRLKSDEQTRTEDFFTEIFAHLLNTHEGIFKNWLRRDILKDYFENLECSIKTQTTYEKLQNHSIDSRPDIVIEVSAKNIRWLMFVESKIDSTGNDEQLKRYAEQLDARVRLKEAKLVYITRDYEKRNIDNIFEDCKNIDKTNFNYLRWHEIYRFLKSCKEEIFVKETLRFMEENNMATSNQFSSVDILALTNFNRVRKMMDETMHGDVYDIFKDFAIDVSQHSVCLTQLRDNNRYIYWSYQQDGMICGYGYWFDSSTITNYPKIGVFLEIPPKFSKRDEFIDVMRTIVKKDPEKWDGYDLTSSRAYSGIMQLRSLREFLSKEDHVIEIANFLKNAINDLKGIKKEYPGLTWKSVN